MAYSDAATLADDAGFQGRVRIALHKKCITVGMPGGWSNDLQKSHYQGLMMQIVNNPDAYTKAFARALAGYSGLTTVSTDPDIDTAIDAIWPVVSGYVAATS